MKQPPFDLLEFRTPAVRHLAWICHAPQLLDGPLSFAPSHYLVADALEPLRYWDRNPTEGLRRLSEAPPRRLGLYFEHLYACLLEDLLGWKLVARNLPVHDGTRTLGELDFLLRNPHTGGLEHHEIAVKFYLGYEEVNRTVLWYGPAARDRLDIKRARMLDHQSQLALRPVTRTTLSALGIDEFPVPRIFLPGYLFYPGSGRLDPPRGVPDDHGRGQWLYADQAVALDPKDWVELRKPHWLGPWMQAEPPDSDQIRFALHKVQEKGIPALFARVEYDGGRQCWKETERFFVVPSGWPQSRS